MSPVVHAVAFVVAAAVLCAVALVVWRRRGARPVMASSMAVILVAAAWWSLADAVEPGGVAAVALLEHLWATSLVEAVQAAGGRTLAEGWLSPEDRDRLPGPSYGGPSTTTHDG